MAAIFQLYFRHPNRLIIDLDSEVGQTNCSLNVRITTENVTGGFQILRAKKSRVVKVSIAQVISEVT